jgi:rhodanese-related sulfurtransferase
MKRLLALWFLLIVFSMDMASCQTKDYQEKLESLYNHTVPLIKTEDLARRINENNLVILDIRSEEEYQVSRIKGARQINYDDFSSEDVDNIPKNSEVVVYCSVGYRSEKVGEKLQELGFQNVKNLYGGIFQWKNEGFEVENSLSMPTDSVHTYNKRWSKWLLKGVRVY